MSRLTVAVTIALAALLQAQAPPVTSYDVVIAGGRVMDPASGTDMVANVGIANGRVAAISKEGLAGRRTLDARGLVVAPGFIDILARPTVHRDGQLFKVTDGVTAVLGMHGGPALIPPWYAAREKAGSLHHFGTTVGHAGSVTGGPEDAGLREKAGVTDPYKAADESQIAEYRTQGGVNVIAHAMPKEELVLALKHPQVMIGSDGVIENGRGHPRGAGTFARVLGQFVREEGVLTLMQALRKMTIMPARRLEKAVPAMRRKGRLSVGADADIAVFDAATVRDRATFQKPAQASEGIRHVLVAGVPVVVSGVAQEGVAPGRAIRRRVAGASERPEIEPDK